MLMLSVLLACSVSLSAQHDKATGTFKVLNMKGTYYSDRFVGRKTSSGEIFSQQKYTAAHNSLKFGTLLLVTNPSNGKQVIVKVNDRCPRKNVLDLSRKAARQIGVASCNVNVQVLPDEYYVFWETQEDFLEVLSRGEFLQYVESHALTLSKRQSGHHNANKGSSSAKSSDNKRGTTPDEAENEDVKTLLPDEFQRYDVELCRCNSRNTAKKHVEQLPFFYQDRVEYKTVLGSNQIVVILTVAAKMNKAEEVLNEVKGLFPEAKIVKSN